MVERLETVRVPGKEEWTVYLNDKQIGVALYKGDSIYIVGNKLSKRLIRDIHEKIQETEGLLVVVKH